MKVPWDPLPTEPPSELIHDTYFLAAVSGAAMQAIGYFYGLGRETEAEIYHPVYAKCHRKYGCDFALQYLRSEFNYAGEDVPPALSTEGLKFGEIDGIGFCTTGPLLSYKIMWIDAVIDDLRDH